MTSFMGPTYIQMSGRQQMQSILAYSVMYEGRTTGFGGFSMDCGPGISYYCQ